LDKKAKADILECLISLNKIKYEYEENPYLIRDPQAYGYLYDTISRLQFLVGQKEFVPGVIKEGIRVSRNQGLLEVVARLHKLEGDLVVAEVLKDNFVSAKPWDPEKLKVAIESYQKGISEISRVDRNAPYVRLCALNQGLATALYALKYTEVEPLDPAKKAELEQLLPAAWSRMLEALAQTKSFSMVDGNPTQTYLKELTTLGLLKEAGNKLRIYLQMPQVHEANGVDFLDAKTEEAFLAEQFARIEKSPESYSKTDRGLVELRMRGIDQLVH